MESGEGSAVMKASGPSLKAGVSNKRCSILGSYSVGKKDEEKKDERKKFLVDFYEKTQCH
jgi:hypothetical protein